MTAHATPSSSSSSRGTARCPAGQDASIFPASRAQARLWFLHQVKLQSTAYNIPASLCLNFPVDMQVLEQSLEALVERHEVLRTTFVAGDEYPMQVIAPTLFIPLPLVDLSLLPEPERCAHVQHLANEQGSRPFDLTQGPLLRTLVVQLGAQEYVLLLTSHQIIVDGWSIGVLFQELASLYTAIASGAPSPLPDLPMQYVDYALWQREQLSEEERASHPSYWKQQLEGAPALLDLPTDRPRPGIPTSRGSTYLLTLPKELTGDLEALSRKEGVSPYTTLVAAFQTLLYRYSGQEDIVLGTYTAGRPRVELEALVGFFVNTLVLRTDLSGNPTFRELLLRVREVVLEAQEHQELPFELLVKELQPERQMGKNPLFQIMLALHPPPPTLPTGWEPSRIAAQTGAAKCDLSLELDDRPAGFLCRFEYSIDLFDEATIARMAGHWQTLLEGIVADPTQRLSELPLLTEKERHQQLVEWNATQVAYPKDTCVHQLFEEQVERTPEAIAAVFEGEQLTYRELNRRANQLAHYLQCLGVGPEVLVGICVERSLDMVVGLLGILKAGGAYVPLDANYPLERLAFMLEDTRAPLLLTQVHLQEHLPQHTAQVAYLDANLEDVERYPITAPASAARPNNLAYVLYTSGSTGKPKGVAMEHRSSVTFIDWATKSFSPQQLAGVLASTSINFDLSVYEIFVPLCCGGTVILCENLLHLSSLLAVKQVTLVNTVPSVLAEFLKGNALPPSVSVVNLAGEPLSRALAQRTYQQDTVQQVFNLYGPTEDTTYSTWNLVQKDASDAPSIGRPLPGTRVYILDQHLQPVPIGVTGELYLSGDKLARGYLNRPELTAERFLRNPFSNAPGARIYKTGDLARYHADGTIEHLGRLDFQVKLRGFRIEMGEIEAVLSQHPAVCQAVVVAREDVPGNVSLIAYFVLRKNQCVTPDELKSHVMQLVPASMVPSAFVLLEMLPLLPNGKVDRRALPAPAPAQPELETRYEAPRDALEEIVATSWSQVLGSERVGIHDDFFALGGHSLLAMQVISRLRTTLQVEVPLHSFFQAPTVARLALAITRLKAKDASPHTAALSRAPREAYRLSGHSLPPGQESTLSESARRRTQL